MKKLLSLLLPLLLLASCTTVRSSYEKEVLLQANLVKWETFKLNGIVEVNYKNLAFRKGIYINKNQQEFDLKVFDGGIFGMTPKPFITAKMDTILSITNASGEKSLFDTSHIPGINFLKNPQLLNSYKDEIINNQTIIVNEKTKIYFSSNMELIKLEQIDSNYKIDFFYNPKLSQIIVTEKKKVLLKIDVDKISYERK